MIRTYYSNSFEVLRGILLTRLNFEIEDLRNSGASIFETIPVIAPSPLVGDSLERSIADHFGVVPGINVTNIASWLYEKLSSSLSKEGISDQMDWRLFKLLKERQHQSRPSEERLTNYLKGLDDCGIMEFSRHVNNVFVTYGSYRFDWLKDWTEEVENKLQGGSSIRIKPHEQAKLIEQPDYLWQKHLWQDLVLSAKHGQTKDGKERKGDFLSWLENTIDGLSNFKAESAHSSIHLFMPFTLAPIMLPIIRAYSLESAQRDVDIYFLNPSSEYWFESLPINLFDWNPEENVERPSAAAPLVYLTSNAASTRAAIDRLDSFIHTSEESNLAEGEPEQKELDRRKNAPVSQTKRHFLTTENGLRPFSETDPSESMKTETEAYFLTYPNDSFLHRFQNSVLKLDSTLLPSKPDPEDVSLRVLKAPSLTREIEATVDILQNWLADPTRDLKLSDILIVLPKIDDAAPIIEGVMTSLPKRSNLPISIPYKILGQSEGQTNQAAVAFIRLGELLNSDFSADRFFNCLELEAVQNSFGFGLEDISVIKNWLTAAGYRISFDRVHRENLGLEEDDCSLQEALERLTVGYLTDDGLDLPFQGVLPIRGDELQGFDTTNDEAGRLFKVISRFCLALRKVRDDLAGSDFMLEADQWRAKLTQISELLIAGTNENDRFRLDKQLDKLCKALVLSLGENEPVSFDVILNEISSGLSREKIKQTGTGVLTFAQIGSVRGLPFKVIACLGFDELSGFPGTPSFEEFDLMKAVPRRADRDARKDNNAVFFDTLMSARENLIISYTAGTKPQSENNPSIVVENFKSYFISNARKSHDAKALWNGITSKIPLNRFSERNFCKGENNLFWRSPRKDILQTIEDQSRKGTHFLFADTGIAPNLLPPLLSKQRELPVSIFVKFLNNPDAWVSKLLSLNDEFQAAEHSELFFDDSDKLMLSKVRKNVVELLNKGAGISDLSLITNANPNFGMPCVRDTTAEDLCFELHSAYEWRRNILPTLAQGPFKKELREDISSLKSFVQTLSDDISDFYRIKGEETEIKFPGAAEAVPVEGLIRVIIPASHSELKRERLRQIIWTALDAPYTLISLCLPVKDTKSKVKKPSPCQVFWPVAGADLLLSVFLKIFDLQLTHVVGFIGDPLSDSNREATSIWRGYPQEVQREAANLSSRISTKILSIINPPKRKTKDDPMDVFTLLKDLKKLIETSSGDQIYG